MRPITAIPYLFQGQTIRAWGGPGKGTVEMDGRNWIPYQAATFPTPPFPEFVSGHSTFSAAGAEILRRFTHSDKFGASVSFDAGTSKYEPNIGPLNPVTLSWATFSQEADEAGLSRRYAAFTSKRVISRDVTSGRLVAAQAWSRATALWSGRE